MVLVPLDGSAAAEAALAAVERLAAATGLRLLLVRAVAPAPAVVAEGHVIMAADEVTALHRREAAAYLVGIARALAERGLAVDTLTAVGDPAETILATATDREVAAVVMATHGRTGLPRILFGSVTAAVVRGSPVPVLTVHRPAPLHPRAPGPSARADSMAPA